MTHWKNLLGIELSTVSEKEKIISAVGGVISIFLLMIVTHAAFPMAGSGCVIASMGASAVLLFGVPHGQLSQPWPVIAGHGFSALIGVACARLIAQQEVAAGCAVGISIGIMHQLKCIHPPGGATALTAVIGGDAVHGMGFNFVWFPVLLNAILMVGLAVAFNAWFGWRRYPAAIHAAALDEYPVAKLSKVPTHEDVLHALRSMDTFVDITEDDLIRLYQDLELSRKNSRM